MDLIGAAEYARLTERGERTVRGWVETLNKESKPLPEGMQFLAGNWFAPREIWDTLAASKGNQGRRDHEPRQPKKKPPTS